MQKYLFIAAAAAAFMTPVAAQAQAIPGAVVAVVDLDRVTSDCTACKTANAALRSQLSALEARQKALATPLETEGKAIQASIDGLKGAEPDAALQGRIRAFQTKQQSGAQEIQRQQQQLQRNQAYIQKQIGDKLGPVYQQVMTRRGANIMVEAGATLATAQAVDVTNDVLAGLNTAMPTIVTTAPAAAATPQKTPQGR